MGKTLFHIIFVVIYLEVYSWINKYIFLLHSDKNCKPLCLTANSQELQRCLTMKSFSSRFCVLMCLSVCFLFWPIIPLLIAENLFWDVSYFLQKMEECLYCFPWLLNGLFLWNVMLTRSKMSVSFELKCHDYKMRWMGTIYTDSIY